MQSEKSEILSIASDNKKMQKNNIFHFIDSKVDDALIFSSDFVVHVVYFVEVSSFGRLSIRNFLPQWKTFHSLNQETFSVAFTLLSSLLASCMLSNTPVLLELDADSDLTLDYGLSASYNFF